jgi:hypothetical protein
MQSRDDGNPGLDRALRALRDADADEATSPAIEQRLRAEVRRIGRARRFRASAVWAGVAAAIVITAIPVRRTFREAPPAATSATEAGPTPVAEVLTEFFPLIYGSVPTTTGHLVRLEVPRSALASFGLTDPPLDGTAPDTIPADVLVGDDGLARAVRFVRQDERGQERR